MLLVLGLDDRDLRRPLEDPRQGAAAARGHVQDDAHGGREVARKDGHERLERLDPARRRADDDERWRGRVAG
jgi:hypothetical protein